MVRQRILPFAMMFSMLLMLSFLVGCGVPAVQITSLPATIPVVQPAQLPTTVPADALVIENGTVIDATGADPIADGIVVIRGERIVAVGPRAGFAIPASAQVVDAMGGTVLPGIINAYVHGTSNPAMRRIYFLLKGVTSVCDMGSPLKQMPPFAQDHVSGRLRAASRAALSSQFGAAIQTSFGMRI